MEAAEHQLYLIIAYYHLVAIADPRAEVERHKAFFAERDIKSRIYISEEGINCQMSAAVEDGRAYCDWISSRGEFNNLSFNINGHGEHVFPRTTVKYRQKLVAFDLDGDADLGKRAEHLTPSEWKALLESEKEHVLLDVRNEYEWAVGHFAGAERPPCQSSRDFKKYADLLKKKYTPSTTPLMMYCTGGIRCEYFSSQLRAAGFEKLFQLQGGVINYGYRENGKHWRGKLFVFDDRLTVAVGRGNAAAVGRCHHCGIDNETYYNCANVNCNELFLCCLLCLQKMRGCCQPSCMEASRLRPYQLSPKPFKKLRQPRDCAIV